MTSWESTMNKMILVHQNNTIAKTIIENRKTLDVETDNIDKEMLDFIATHISNKNLQTIFIKDSLSKNYLEFYGLLLAHHIRLSNDATIKYLPIIIISDLNIYQLNKLTPLANICYTEGVYLVDNDLSKINNILIKDLLGLEQFNFNHSFLECINIKPPSNYDSKHSIANEWAIYQWSEFLEIKIDTIEANISSMLYFKYLQAKNIKESLLTRDENPPQKFSQEGKILFIDDEYAKGWGEIFKEQFESNPNFSILEKEYKGKKRNKIIEMVTDSIDINNLPDIIILDLRLCDDDFNFNDDKDLDKITGMQLIKKIHDINPAIQIILWTASGDSNILNKANNLNILGYIKKEYPGDRTADVNSNIKIMSSLIDKGLEKKYLKKVWDIQEDILKLNIFKEDEFKEDEFKKDKFKEMNFEIKSIFEILDSEMKNRFNYTIFTIFKCIEIISYLYIEEKDRKACWNDSGEIINDTGYHKYRRSIETSNLEHIKNENNKRYNNQGNISVENKIRTIMHEKLDITLDITSDELHSQIKCIVCVRNHLIHSDKEYEEKDFCKKIIEEQPTKENILTWFKMLQTILEKIAK